MKRILTTLALACYGASLLSSNALAQNPPWADQDRANRQFNVAPFAAIAVPGTSTANPFKSFDIIYLDPQTQLMVLSSRSSKAVAIYDALFDVPIGETAAVFAGVGSSNDISGPNGVVIAGDLLFAGDYPSTVRVFDLRASLTQPPQIAAINTGGTQRADEMDYDPADKVVAVSNGDTSPAFVSLISTKTLKITRKIVFDGSHGTPNASPGGIGSILYDPDTGKFLVSIPQLGTDLTAGAVAVMDPVTGAIEKVFPGIDKCMAAGMAKGPGENVLVGCDPGFPAPDPALFAPRTYVINGRTGDILADIKQVGGEDEVWYNPGDRHYYTGSRDFFTSPAATAATPVLGVIDADTNQWIENVPTGTNAHSVTANPINNHIYVPLENPNAICGSLPGCIGVFRQTHHDNDR